MNEFRQLQVGDAEITFEIKEGRVIIKPFETSLAGSKATIEGSSGLDQSIDYNINLAIPKNKLGTQTNQVISGMFAKVNSSTGTNIQLPDPVKINIKIGGTILQPKITTDLAQQAGNSIQQVKEEIKEQITQKVEQTIDNAKQKAKEQADKLLADAELQAQQIRNAAKASADKVRAEGYAAADKLVNDAKNPIAKAAAQETAKKMKQEADKKAQSIIDEGNKNAQKVIDEARKKADDLLK
jgi:vacuolar-type H+-ATPase subunit H